MSIKTGTLYVVATPIGNLGDMSPRACEVLEKVDRIAAEDTRHSLALMRHFGINTPMISLHEHNERDKSQYLLGLLRGGESIALISDAGTPLISDPGYHLVSQARQAGVEAVAIPGPSAVAAALSISGLPTDRFVFEGFLPAKHQARVKRLQALENETRTLVFYESSHRIVASLTDMAGVFGAGRDALVARELTKLHEQVSYRPLGELVAWLQQDSNRQRGEFVVMVHGAEEQPLGEQEVERILGILLEELPLKQASALAARITGLNKNALYKQALAMNKKP